MLPEQRTTLKPIEIIQPEGPSFIAEGHNIKWQNWDLRISMHPVHALVLHDVKFHDRDFYIVLHYLIWLYHIHLII